MAAADVVAPVRAVLVMIWAAKVARTDYASGSEASRDG
jgi:hypothetical protein